MTIRQLISLGTLWIPGDALKSRPEKLRVGKSSHGWFVSFWMMGIPLMFLAPSHDGLAKFCREYLPR